jgi:hypothetical protein
LNGYGSNAPEKELAEIVLALARGQVTKADIVVFVRKWASKA